MSDGSDAVLDGVLHQLGIAVQLQVFHDAVLMKLDCARRNMQNRGDLFGGMALCHQLQDLALARGERIDDLLTGGAFLRDRRCDVDPAGESLPDRRHQLGRGRVFEDVSRGTRFQGAIGINQIVMHGQDDDLRPRMRFTELPGGLDAVQERHRNVDHDDVRVMPGGCGEQRPSVADRADQVEFVNYTGRNQLLEMRKPAIKPGTRVLLVDQWIETGGTMEGAIALVERQGGIVAGIATVCLEENERTKKFRETYLCSTAVVPGSAIQEQCNRKTLDSFATFDPKDIAPDIGETG